tara:strand:+ start:144 stop:599 length:456 start_codon:yes stop_codon:yes gene_type:complete
MKLCTRRIEFDAAHRITRHESKCAHLHGHRYVVDIQCGAAGLDDAGRVIDFGRIKDLVGRFVDINLDHGTLLCESDAPLLKYVQEMRYKHWAFEYEPTAENLAAFLFKAAEDLLADEGIVVMHVRVYETPNCWADYDRGTYCEENVSDLDI